MRSIRAPRFSALAAACLLLLASCSRNPVAPTSSSNPRPARAFSGNDGVTDRVVVTLAPGVDAPSLGAAYGATLVDWEPMERTAAYLPPAGSTPADFALVLSADASVVTCEEDGFLEPSEARQQSFSFDDGFGNEQTFAEQPAAAALHLAQAHRASTGRGVRVAILDTGIDSYHTALRARLEPGYDFLDGDADPTDRTNGLDDDFDGNVDEAFGHGTHVAGIVALVAPEARIIPVRVLDADGRGNVLSVAAGIRWAVANGADVINLSLGTLRNVDAIQDALSSAEHEGIVVIASAGNWGAPTPVEYPATSSHATAIGATDAAAQPATFSSYGNFVALSAPGVGVRSTFPGGGYRVWSGTSMSAPFVAGVAALLKSVHPAWTMTEVVGRMTQTVTPITGGTQPQRQGLGAGMLDAGAALAADPVTPATEGDGDPGVPIRRPGH